MTIKPPRGGMVFMVAWIGFLCLLMVAGAASEHHVQGLFLVFVWLPWLVPVALIARTRITADDDILTYRGPFRTRVWCRSQIEGFAIIPTPGPLRASRLYLHTADGHWIALLIGGSAWPGSTAQLQSRLSALEEWRLTSSQQPS